MAFCQISLTCVLKLLRAKHQSWEHSLGGQELVIQHTQDVCFILAPEREESRKGDVPGLHCLQRLGEF